MVIPFGLLSILFYNWFGFVRFRAQKESLSSVFNLHRLSEFAL